ncbi:hypothetical protein MMC14_000583 [Varicellaria rhodocarpa]|nr:hypothetical protein [Varicellaria rhodocarpa]
MWAKDVAFVDEKIQLRKAKIASEALLQAEVQRLKEDDEARNGSPIETGREKDEARREDGGEQAVQTDLQIDPSSQLKGFEGAGLGGPHQVANSARPTSSTSKIDSATRILGGRTP